MTATFSTPTEVIESTTLQGTRRERVAQKREAIRIWLGTTEGQEYLASLLDDRPEGTIDNYKNMVLEEAGLRDVHENRGRLTKSKRGTWATEIGSTAYALTRDECVRRGLPPGPGND